MFSLSACHLAALLRGLSVEAGLRNVDVVGLAVRSQEDAVAVSGLDERRGPRLLLYRLEELVVAAIEHDDGMSGMTLKVRVVKTAFQASQFVAGMQAQDVEPGRKFDDIALQHPFIARHEIGIVRGLLTILIIEDEFHEHFVLLVRYRGCTHLGYTDVTCQSQVGLRECRQPEQADSYDEQHKP